MPHDPEDTRRRIVDAANRLFYGQGIRPVSMDEVAEAASVTKRTLYYHFASKEALVVAYLEHRSTRQQAGRAGSASLGSGGAMARLMAFFDSLEAQFTRGGHFRGCAFINAVAELADSEPARLVAATHKEGTRAWFEALLRELAVGAPQQLSEQLLLLADGALAAWLVRRDAGAATSARDAARVLVLAAMTNEEEVSR